MTNEEQEATNKRIIEGLSEDQINIALTVLKTINCRSAYGNNPNCCGASAEIIHLLERKDEQEEIFDLEKFKKQLGESLIEACKYSKEQMDKLEVEIKELLKLESEDKAK